MQDAGMNSYQKEQIEALSLVQGYLANLALDARQNSMEDFCAW